MQRHAARRHQGAHTPQVSYAAAICTTKKLKAPSSIQGQQNARSCVRGALAMRLRHLRSSDNYSGGNSEFAMIDFNQDHVLRTPFWWQLGACDRRSQQGFGISSAQNTILVNNSVCGEVPHPPRRAASPKTQNFGLFATPRIHYQKVATRKVFRLRRRLLPFRVVFPALP